MAEIVLTTLNARFSHASLGLRYLLANMGELRPKTDLREFVIGVRTEVVVEQILALQPVIVGIGVYIWNVDESTRLIAMLKAVAPELIVVVGGPEVSYESDQQTIARLADHVIAGAADRAFATLCGQLLDSAPARQGPPRLIQAADLDPLALNLPYREYSDDDLRHRYVYVEASRGCPYRCEFCLSSLDKTARPFDQDQVLSELETLYQRGARTFKFVDRTFNLRIAHSVRILQFFLQKLAEFPEQELLVHFELVPDHLPEKLRSELAQFPAGALHLEIGIQTWNPQVQALISRRQDNLLAEQNIRWLVQHTKAHLHVDLLAGLPGETLASLADGFDRLVALQPHEIQLGILKRLRGAPIARHTSDHDLRFNPSAPYNLLASDTLSFEQMQRISRFARYWDLLANSGRFTPLLPQLLGDSPFARFLAFSDWLYSQTDRTYRLAPDRLASLVESWLAQRADSSSNERRYPDLSRPVLTLSNPNRSGQAAATPAHRQRRRQQATIPIQPIR